MEDTTYKCGYCGRAYRRLEDRIACEQACQQALRREELAKQAAIRREAKQRALDNVEALIKERDELDKKIADAALAYQKEYGPMFEQRALFDWILPC